MPDAGKVAVCAGIADPVSRMPAVASFSDCHIYVPKPDHAAATAGKRQPK